MLKDDIIWERKNSPYDPSITEIKGTLSFEYTQGYPKPFLKDSQIEKEVKRKIAQALWHKLYGRIFLDLQDIYYECGSESIRNLLKNIEEI